MHLMFFFFFFLWIPRPPRSTLFPYTRSSDLAREARLNTPAMMFAGEVKRLQSPLWSPGLTSAETEAVSPLPDRKSTRLNSSHLGISYAVFCLKKKKKKTTYTTSYNDTHTM